MNITKQVIKTMKELSGEDNVSENMSLKEDLALDSLSMVTLLVEIETVFHIELKEEDMNPFELSTVQDVIDMVNRYCGDITDE